MKSFICTSALMSLALAATVATTAQAQAVPSLGSTAGQIGFNIFTGGSPAWFDAGSNASNGYNFVYTTASLSAVGTDNTVTLQGVASPLPVGSSYLALDGDFNLAPGALGAGGVAVGTDMTNLMIGTKYTVSYYASDSQQTGYGGDTSDNVTACAGGTTASPQTGTCTSTGVVLDPDTNSNPGSANYTPWVEYTLNFTATGTSELLSFMDAGQPGYPNQEPSFALIDGISVAQTPSTPEPSSLLLLGTGLAGLSGFVRSRFKKATV